ncbi:hypothetical protein THAR02_10706 [Trichoderma harzianum]|uniref:Uncharacterized protein n=1 Tax=Trichoderma harzianum TaxID=5544 RepID=A0A0F9WXL6_TRIHA|nr:hypothetical protein THAR02_10706 [Trichoderma harzianum]
MRPFETPRPSFCPSQLRAWFDSVEDQMQDDLEGDYWTRFNTIQIPILGESDYFNTAIKIAKRAKGRKAEFERIFEERNKKQKEKLLSFMSKAANQTKYDEIFPCNDAREIVSQVCLTGCLLDFLLLLNGNAFGWEADMAGDMHLDGDTESPVDQELYAPNDEELHCSLDPCGHDDPGTETQWLEDDFYNETPMERQMRKEDSANATYYIGTFTYTRCATNSSVGTTVGPINPTIDSLVSEKKTQRKHGKRKRDQLDDVADSDYHRERKSSTPSSTSHAAIEQRIDTSATGENSTLDNNSVYKRRKLESPFILEPASINSSSQLAAGKGAVKKRSRYHDCNDHDHRQKRQKTSPTSSSIQPLIDKQVASEKKEVISQHTTSSSIYDN